MSSMGRKEGTMVAGEAEEPYVTAAAELLPLCCCGWGWW